MPILPPPSPPFHQTSLPARPAPLRKLQAVRFSIQTSSAFQTTRPFSPSGPFEPAGPKFWSAWLRLHGREPRLVPSTTTLLRFIPRRCRSGVVISTPAGVSEASFGARLERVL